MGGLKSGPITGHCDLSGLFRVEAASLRPLHPHSVSNGLSQGSFWSGGRGVSLPDKGEVVVAGLRLALGHEGQRQLVAGLGKQAGRPQENDV